MRLQKWAVAVLSGLVLMGWFSVGVSDARAQNTSTPTRPTATYNSIVGQNGVGLVFAGICQSKKVDGEPNEEDDCACRGLGQCSVSDMVQLFVNITVLILGISGSVVLLMFVIGGGTWILSNGKPELVTRGKQTMEHAVIGLAIILLAYTAINFLIAALAGDEEAGTLENTINNAQN